MRIGLIKRRTKSHRAYNEFAGFSVYRAGRLVCGEEGHQSGYMDRDDFEPVRDCAVCAEQAMRGHEVYILERRRFDESGYRLNVLPIAGQGFKGRAVPILGRENTKHAGNVLRQTRAYQPQYHHIRGLSPLPYRRTGLRKAD
jgi:hypothetical protein